MNPEEKNTNQPAPVTPTPSADIPTKPDSLNTIKVDAHDPIKSLRTYQGDVNEAMTKNKSSITSIFIAEQNKRDKTSLDQNIEKPKDTEARNKFFILIGITLLILGIITVVSVFYIQSKEEVILELRTKALITFSEEKEILTTNSNREDLVNNIITEKQLFKLPINSVLYLNTINADKTPAKLEEVLRLIAPKMLSSLSRSFDAKYMLGVYSFDTNEPFIILKTTDYASSFSGMLRWEKDMVADLGKMFNIGGFSASSTPSFIDVEIKNKDLRVLKNDTGKTVLLYSFVDKETLLITSNENIFSAIFSKYITNLQTR